MSATRIAALIPCVVLMALASPLVPNKSLRLRASSNRFAASENSRQGTPPRDIELDPVDRKPLKLIPRRITLKKGNNILNVPQGFDIAVAAEGFKRPRFMTTSPDGRVFVTDLFNRTDNSRGAVYILEGFDPKTKRFSKATPYLTSLRNPNSVAFFVDGEGAHWFCLALTDRLVRYRYTPGENHPASEAQVLAKFPDYGLNYKYGGWHLTRTLAVSNGKLYVSVGSSCDACEETESVRASVVEMELDGSNQRRYASGLRNAVGMKTVRGRLFATDMGSDHLGDNKPEDTMHILRENADYGWPYCFEYKSKLLADPRLDLSKKKLDCSTIPVAYVAFAAHSSPLGFEYFDSANTDPGLKNYFLVALHGSSKRSLGQGYRIARVKRGVPIGDFITGFLRGRRVYGRPADIMSVGKDSFFFTDDYAGVVYYVFKKGVG